MPDPRNTVDFTGTVRENQITFNTDGTLPFDATVAGGSPHAGKAVGLVANGQLGLVADGAPVAAQLLHVQRDGKATAMVTGVATLPRGAGLAPVIGGRVVSNGAGAVRGVAPATLADVAAGRGLVLAFDTTTVTVALGV